MNAARAGCRAEVLTPIGPIPAATLQQLRLFGAQAERNEFPFIAVGGFIVPGQEPAQIPKPGQEQLDYVYASSSSGWEESAREEAGSATGPWEGRASPQAAPGATPHALDRELRSLKYDWASLIAYHPLARVVLSTERFIYVNLPLGLIHGLPIGVRLSLEVPTARLPPPQHDPQLTSVPDVRAWAVWEGCVGHGGLVRSHHQYPDHALCVCMAGEWRMGRDPLHHYVAYCALWAAKVLYEQLLGSFPGHQHVLAVERVVRDRPAEYCGCGSSRRYADCCRDDDALRSPYSLWRESFLARDKYMADLRSTARAERPNSSLLRLGLQ